MNDRDITVDPAGFDAAMEALIMDDPYPNSSFGDSPAHWLRRALYAYEWAKRSYPDAGQDMFSRSALGPGRAREAVLRYEAGQCELGERR
ncbi:hypothetical protein [Nocardia sp. NBC_01329]|uniref:hypothetical protein n=1 Tax=Nocardia sp. NBC_01329 TaxID=2903594 RepID=UPI002E114342|nr:hypothetical protein OG405_13840 [Nocardia sp. NBC_01329]